MLRYLAQFVGELTGSSSLMKVHDFPTRSHQPSAFDQVPLEIWEIIVRRLNMQDTVCLAFTCKRMKFLLDRSVAEYLVLWRQTSRDTVLKILVDFGQRLSGSHWLCAKCCRWHDDDDTALVPRWSDVYLGEDDRHPYVPGAYGARLRRGCRTTTFPRTQDKKWPSAMVKHHDFSTFVFVGDKNGIEIWQAQRAVRYHKYGPAFGKPLNHFTNILQYGWANSMSSKFVDGSLLIKVIQQLRWDSTPGAKEPERNRSVCGHLSSTAAYFVGRAIYELEGMTWSESDILHVRTNILDCRECRSQYLTEFHRASNSSQIWQIVLTRWIDLGSCKHADSLSWRAATFFLKDEKPYESRIRHKWNTERPTSLRFEGVEVETLGLWDRILNIRVDAKGKVLPPLRRRGSRKRLSMKPSDEIQKGEADLSGEEDTGPRRSKRLKKLR